MTDVLAATRRHESAHTAACLVLGGERRVVSVRVDHPEVGVLGKMTSTLDREVGPEDLIINVIGWMADPSLRSEWPPAWPVPVDAKEGIGLLVRYLKLTERQYRGLVGVAEDLLADPAFQRLAGLIEQGLARSPILDAEAVEILLAAADPEPEGATCT